MQFIEIIIQNLQLNVDKLTYMKKILISIAFILTLTATSERVFAWGKTGHELVAEIAFHFLDDSTQKIVKDFLGNLSIEEAANWMDDSRGNSYYDYMRTWHYLDMDKGVKYEPSGERNILTVMHSAITELKQYKTLKKSEVKRDLLLIFHLIGDLHQPLHCGYAVDKGGNTISVTGPFVSGNLHSVWDTQILEYEKTNLDSCLEFYKATFGNSNIGEITKINEMHWMNESRSYLDTVYSFKDNFLDKNYVDSNILVIKKQLLLAGLRLAAVLKQTFNPGKLLTDNN